MKYKIATLLLAIMVLIISCSKKERISEDAIVTKFTRDSYYKTSIEAPDSFLSKIKDKLTKEDSVLLCSRFNNSSLDNLSANIVVSFKNHSIDTVFIMGVITFDKDGTPLRDTAKYDWLQNYLNEVKLLDSTELDEGSLPMRMQLEKLCK